MRIIVGSTVRTELCEKSQWSGANGEIRNPCEPLSAFDQLVTLHVHALAMFEPEKGIEDPRLIAVQPVVILCPRDFRPESCEPAAVLVLLGFGVDECRAVLAKLRIGEPSDEALEQGEPQ